MSKNVRFKKNREKKINMKNTEFSENSQGITKKYQKNLPPTAQPQAMYVGGQNISSENCSEKYIPISLKHFRFKKNCEKKINMKNTEFSENSQGITKKYQKNLPPTAQPQAMYVGGQNISSENCSEKYIPISLKHPGPNQKSKPSISPAHLILEYNDSFGSSSTIESKANSRTLPLITGCGI